MRRVTAIVAASFRPYPERPERQLINVVLGPGDGEIADCTAREVTAGEPGETYAVRMVLPALRGGLLSLLLEPLDPDGDRALVPGDSLTWVNEPVKRVPLAPLRPALRALLAVGIDALDEAGLEHERPLSDSLRRAHASLGGDRSVLDADGDHVRALSWKLGQGRANPGRPAMAAALCEALRRTIALGTSEGESLPAEIDEVRAHLERFDWRATIPDLVHDRVLRIADIFEDIVDVRWRRVIADLTDRAR
jgi:hypothetical protein